MKILNFLISSLMFTTSLFAMASDHQINLLKTDLPSGHYEAMTYLPIKKHVKAILILSPTIAGVSILEKINANYFSQNGFLVIIPLPFLGEVESMHPDTAKLDADFIRPALAADKFIMMVEDQFKLPPNLPVFALGASQGGIRTLSITAHNPRIKAAWFATAGGDLASIYANSSVEKIIVFKKRHMEVLGITDGVEYEEYLRANLKNDLALTCEDIKVPFVQTMTLKDDKVPTSNQELLVTNCPAHKVIKINSGHVIGSLSTVKWRKKILLFFLEQL